MAVVSPSNGVLNATPSAFIGRGEVLITLRLYDTSGHPIEGASISGACEQVNGGNLAIIAGPSVTNASGVSTVRVSVSLDGINEALNGTCTFATASGDPFVDVNFTGADACVLTNGGILPSPLPPAGACTPDQYTVGGSVSGLTVGNSLVLQNSGSASLTINSNTNFTFPAQDDNSAYNISVTTQPVGQTCTVANGSGTVSGSNVTDVAVTCI